MAIALFAFILSMSLGAFAGLFLPGLGAVTSISIIGAFLIYQKYKQ